MNTEEWFIDGNNLPNSLPKNEFDYLLRKVREGDSEALEKLVTHNIRLVLYEVAKKYKNTDYDKKELVAAGNLGLLKALNTYDLSKEIAFPTYAVKCIDNEMLMYLRKNKKHQGVDSIDKIVCYDKNGNEMKLEDKLSSDIDVAGNYEKQETYRAIREIVNNLPDRDREIVIMYFGFDDYPICTQVDIAEKLHISQSYASRVINKILANIKKQLEAQKVIEVRKKRPRKKRVSSCLTENTSTSNLSIKIENTSPITRADEKKEQVNKIKKQKETVKVLKLKKI